MLPKLKTALFSLTLFISSILFSWIIWSKVDFAYPALHYVMGIEQHIDKYGPQNRYRKGFELTDKPEQVRLFSEIVDAIHNEGQGLKELVYFDGNGKPIRRLLRHPEVVHLKDVANLVDSFYLVSTIALAILIAVIVYMFYKKQPFPSLKQQAIGILSFSAVSTILILIIGPVKVFYALHEWVFPENHQWFFYYQESLMTVLMKAPDLFGAIAALISVLAIGIYLAINTLLQKYSRPKHPH